MQVEVARTIGRLTLNGAAGWEGDVSGHGQERRLRAGAAVVLASWLSVGGHFGGFAGASGADHDHAFYDIGVTATWRRLSFNLRYGGTNLLSSECFYTHWCRARRLRRRDLALGCRNSASGPAISNEEGEITAMPRRKR